MKTLVKLFAKGTVALALVLMPVSYLRAQTQGVPMNASGAQALGSSGARIHASDIHITEDAESLLANEMTLHMSGARLAVTNKDYQTAAEEIRLVQAHVQSQFRALQNVNIRLNQLILDTQAGKVTPAELDQAFTQVRYASDRLHHWIPIASEEVDVFMPEMDYHLTRARQEWQAGEHQRASKNVWLAVSYLRARQDALPANKTDKRDALRQAEKDLDRMATRIQNVEHLSAKQIDSTFGEASAAWNASF